jgi:hypothetical protein
MSRRALGRVMWTHVHRLKSEARRLAISQEDAMKIRSLVTTAHIGFMGLLVVGIVAEAAELT